MVPREIFDVLVIGGGPAGATAALQLAKHGYRVAVVDKRVFPRDKVCGDGLIADSIHYLKRNHLFDRVRPEAHEITTVSIFSPSRAQIDIPGYCLTIRRHSFDHLLLEAAREAGAYIYEGKVNQLVTDGKMARAYVIGQTEPIQARVAVVATGADVGLMRQQGLVKRIKPSAVAVRCYVRSPFKIDSMVLSYDRSVLPGYAWIFPMKNDEYNIGCGYAYTSKTKNYPDPRILFDTFCKDFPLANQLMVGAEILSPIQGSVLRYGLKGITPQKDNIIAVGETIATTYPFTGEGIGKAMETAEIAAGLIDTALRNNSLDALADYAPLLNQKLKPKYLGYELAEKWCSRVWFVELVMKRAQKSERIRNAISKVLDESIDLRKAFTLRRVLKLVFAAS